MTMNENEIVIPSDQVIRGLKAKLVYEKSELQCTPANKCACDRVLKDIKIANQLNLKIKLLSMFLKRKIEHLYTIIC